MEMVTLFALCSQLVRFTQVVDVHKTWTDLVPLTGTVAMTTSVWARSSKFETVR